LYIVETKGLTKEYKNTKAVNGIDLKIKEGSIYGFLGPNGAGKSTTIQMLLGLIKSTKGDAHIFGMSIKENRLAILKDVGAMVEEPSYYGNLTARENLEIIADILQVDNRRIDEVLEEVGLNQTNKKLVKHFSLGMKQRLAIAQSLIGNPKLLILDEPTNGLDPSGICEIRELILKLRSKYNITILLSSHLLSEIELIATHVGIINKGKIVFQGTMDSLKKAQKKRIKIGANDLQGAKKILLKNKYEIQIEENFIYVHNEHVNPESINRHLIENDVDIYHLSNTQKCLEEIYLSMTHESKEVN